MGGVVSDAPDSEQGDIMMNGSGWFGGGMGGYGGGMWFPVVLAVVVGLVVWIVVQKRK